MSLVIPGFTARYEKEDLIRRMALWESYEAVGAGQLLDHARYVGELALNEERFGRIVDWIVSQSRRS